MTVTPFGVFASFFDDARLEIGNKWSFIGRYLTEAILAEGAPPFDRLAVWVHLRVPRDQIPSKLTIRINVPRQDAIIQEIEPQFPSPDQSDDATPFSAAHMDLVMHLRFLPLQVGDAVEVWLVVDEQEIPAGRLQVKAHPLPIAQA